MSKYSFRPILWAKISLKWNNPGLSVSELVMQCFVLVALVAACIRMVEREQGKQQYCCKDCGKRFISHYSYRAYVSNTNDQIIRLLKEGVGMRGIARLLRISVVTLLNRIRLIAAKLRPPYIIKGKQYEVDEIKTFVVCCIRQFASRKM